MLKNVFMKTVAIVSALPIAVAMPTVTAFATENAPIDDTISVSGDYVSDVETIDKDAVNAQAGVEINITGDVSAESTTNVDNPSDTVNAVTAGGHSTVNITGDVSSSNTGDAGTITVEAGDSTVYIDGDVTNSGKYHAINGSNSNITVTGDVSAPNNRAVVVNGGTTKIDGSVSSEYIAIEAFTNAKVTVGEDVEISGTSAAIEMNSNSEITVGKNVSSNGTGIIIWVDKDATSKGKIDIKGTLKGTTALAYAPLTDTMIFSSAQQVTDVLPEITVYELVSTESNSDILLYGETNAMPYWRDIYNYYYENINYYIHKSDEVEIISSSSANPNTMKTTDYLEVSIPEGKVLQINNNTMQAVRQENGNYRVYLTSMKGGITLDAIKQVISEATGEKKEDIQVTVVETEPTVEVTPVATNNYGAPAGAITVNTVTTSAPIVVSNADAVGAPAAIIPARTVSLDVKQVTGAQLQQVIVDNVKATPAGTALRIETSEVSTFDSKMIEAIAANPTIDVEVIFTYNGQKLRVVIPAGYNVRSLLDSNGYCGYLRLAALLGSQVVIG